ncbi:hypothetical protein BTO04_11005 [Polaribacter sp. SA4-10]|uniref:hypothetical protein n=1 Tax=Polaribacter sp. SA4-10 TaxID=754397 RepID=UPI000B3D445C|nr:hypothetical protein [Polaribacter sp. SA4-10]ARV07180.1 hypothetical protein BTO04_11005 [Polaribacter sp. SA4-10]
MKVTIKILVLFFLTSVTFQTTSQNLAYNNVDYIKDYPKNNATTSSKALANGSYFYRTNTKKVLVEINGNSYTEYHPNNEFIKAEINWTTSNSYKLIITEIKKADLPFKKGTELKTEILKVKGKKYIYKSTLGNNNWTGKLIKVSE